MCYENQVIERSEGDGRTPTIDGQILKGKHKESINVLGMVTLSDMDMLYSEGRTGRGWIACEYLAAVPAIGDKQVIQALQMRYLWKSRFVMILSLT